jgi:hypothetical protein
MPRPDQASSGRGRAGQPGAPGLSGQTSKGCLTAAVIKARNPTSARPANITNATSHPSLVPGLHLFFPTRRAVHRSCALDPWRCPGGSFWAGARQNQRSTLRRYSSIRRSDRALTRGLLVHLSQSVEGAAVLVRDGPFSGPSGLVSKVGS